LHLIGICGEALYTTYMMILIIITYKKELICQKKLKHFTQPIQTEMG
jgi:hypothetical protein